MTRLRKATPGKPRKKKSKRKTKLIPAWWSAKRASSKKRKKSRKRKTPKPHVTIVRKNPYEEYAISGVFMHNQHKYYWTGVNWNANKSTSLVWRYKEQAIQAMKSLASKWRKDYPKLYQTGIVRVT
jgi:hypothetical protein